MTLRLKLYLLLCYRHLIDRLYARLLISLYLNSPKF